MYFRSIQLILWVTLYSYLYLRLWPDDDPEMRPKHVVNLNEIKIQTILVVFWLTKLIPYLKKKCTFVLRTVRNAQIRCVAKVTSFFVLQTLVRRVTIECYTVKSFKEIWLQYQKTRAYFRRKKLGGRLKGPTVGGD